MHEHIKPGNSIFSLLVATWWRCRLKRRKENLTEAAPEVTRQKRKILTAGTKAEAPQD